MQVQAKATEPEGVQAPAFRGPGVGRPGRARAARIQLARLPTAPAGRGAARAATGAGSLRAPALSVTTVTVERGSIADNTGDFQVPPAGLRLTEASESA